MVPTQPGRSGIARGNQRRGAVRWSGSSSAWSFTRNFAPPTPRSIVRRTIAEGALAGERRFLYYNRVTFAERQMNDNDPYRAEQLLDECPSERRNWEWHYLKRQCHTDLLSFQAHRGEIWSLAISPDGRLIATGGGDKTLRLWEAKTGQEVRTISGYVASVWSAAFSPDGMYIASVSGARSQLDHVRVHEVETGKAVAFPTTKDTGQLSSVAFSADGGRLVIAGGELESDSWVAVRDARTGLEPLRIAVGPDPAESASLSPDGNSLLAVVGSNNPTDFAGRTNEARVWDTKTSMLRFILRGHTKPILKAYFSPDGSKIATGGYDATVRIWDASTGRELRTLRGHRSCVNMTRFSPDGRRIASASDDGTAKIWDVETGEERTTLRGHRGAFSSVVFSPDGQRLITSGFDGAVKVWDANVSPEARTVVASDSAVLVAAFSPDGHTLLTAGADRQLKLWEVPSGRPLDTWSDHKECIWRVAFSRDGKRVASAAGDWQRSDQLGEVFIWDVTTGRLVHSLRAAPWDRPLRGVQPGQSVAGLRGRRKKHTWTRGRHLGRGHRGQAARTFPDLKNGSYQVAFSPDGRRLAATANDLIHTWDAQTGEKLLTLKGHSDSITDFAFSPDGRLILSTGEAGSLRIWDSISGRPTRIFVSEKWGCYCLAVSPDGTRVASAGADQTIKIWDPEIDQALITLRGHLDTVLSVAFSPDGD